MYLSTNESPAWRRTRHTRRTELTCHELTRSDSVTHWLLGHICTRSCKTGTGTCSLSIPKSSVAIQHSVLKTELPLGSLELSMGKPFISEKPPEKPPFPPRNADFSSPGIPSGGPRFVVKDIGNIVEYLWVCQLILPVSDLFLGRHDIGRRRRRLGWSTASDSFFTRPPSNGPSWLQESRPFVNQGSKQ